MIKNTTVNMNTSNNRIEILEIPFDKVTMESALNLILQRLKTKDQQPFFIATPNPEMLLAARKNQEFKKILQNTDLNIPDGFGIILAAKVNHTPLLQRVTGTDLMQKICEHAPKGTKIFLLGAGPGIAEKTGEKLVAQNPNLKIVGNHSGSAAIEEEQSILQMINDSGAEILFVAFGAPKQELWIVRNLHNLKTVKVVMGVGGAFDFISGTRKRAPNLMRKIGLEWLFRLIIQPTRIKRIYNATIKFPLVFIAGKLFHKK